MSQVITVAVDLTTSQSLAAGITNETITARSATIAYTQIVSTAVLSGAAGKSAYQIAVDNGYVGSEADWLLSLKAESPTSSVSSVNGQTDAVVLNADDIDDTSTINKYVSAANISKLDSVESGAEANNITDTNATDLTDGTDTPLHFHASDRNRANHTGAQAISTVTGLQTALDSKQATGDYATNTALNSGLATKSDTTHNHTLTSLTEKSYNSLTDKPTIPTTIVQSVGAGTNVTVDNTDPSNPIVNSTNSGVTAINDLSDVTLTTPTSGQVLKYNGTAWTNDTDATSSGGTGVTDHGALTGLADDDHLQYHNDARGDARYYVKATVDSYLADKANTTDLANYLPLTGGTLSGNLQTGQLFQVNAATGNPEMQLMEAGITRAKFYYDTVGNRFVIQNNETNADDGVYITEGLTITGNFTSGGTVDGRILATDGTKLDGIEAGAQVNEVTQLELDNGLATKANSSHTHDGADITGTGKSATTFLRGDNTWVTPTDTTYSAITQVEVENAVSTTAGLITGQRMSQGVAAHAPVKSVAGKTGAVTLAKADVGLTNVDNTSDVSKPVSTATQTALDSKLDISSERMQIGDIVMTLNTTARPGRLLLDGSTYNQADYPAFYSHASGNPAYLATSSATTFTVIDMRARVPMGQFAADSSFDTLGEKGGAKEHRHLNPFGFDNGNAFWARDGSDNPVYGSEVISVKRSAFSLANASAVSGARLMLTTNSSSLPPYIVVNYEVVAL